MFSPKQYYRVAMILFLVVVFVMTIFFNSRFYVSVDYVKFSPPYDLKETIISEIQDARISIDLMIFKFDDLDIAEALINAKNNGLYVRVLVDERSLCYMNKYSDNIIYRLAKSGVIIKIYDNRPSILHHKVLMIDGSRVIFGSSNFFTYDLQNNLEDLIFVKDSEFYKLFFEQMNKIWNSEKTYFIDYNEKNNFSKCSIEISKEKEIGVGGLGFSNRGFKQEKIFTDVYFNTENDLSEIILSSTRSATENIYVMASILQYKPFIDALNDATKRGVDVYVMSNFESEYGHLFLRDVKYEIYDPQQEGVLHNKFIVIDNEKLLVGSFNLFERSLFQDLENLVVFGDKNMSTLFINYFMYVWDSNLTISS